MTLSHDEFYQGLIQRNQGLIDPADQHRLRQATVLVAGCGSIGGAAVEPLVRLGAEHLILAEPGCYDLANLNRQRAWASDVGRNKAQVQAERAGRINPFSTVRVVEDGITSDNVAGLVAGADIILDGVDVTTPEPIRHKLALHRQAAQAGVPVLSGYDVAGTQALLIYDYRDPRVRPLRGRIEPAAVPARSPLAFLARVVPRAAIPGEIMAALRRLAGGADEGFPQLVYTADLFGVLACRAVIEVLARRGVRNTTVLDVHQLLRPAGPRLQAGLARLIGLLRLRRDIVS